MSKDAILEELKVELSEPQIKKLVKGQAVQLKPHMIGKGIPLALDKRNARKIKRAVMQGKGARLRMMPHEIDGSGLWKFIKKAVRLVNKVIPIKDIAKSAAKVVLPAVATAVGGPAAGAVVSNVPEKYGDKVIDVVAEQAGLGVRARGVRAKGVKSGKGVRAKGLGRGMKKLKSEGGALIQNYGMSEKQALSGAGIKKTKAALRAPFGPTKQMTVSDNSSYFMAPTSAAMNPPVDAVSDQSYRIPLYRGDGLLPSGYRR